MRSPNKQSSSNPDIPSTPEFSQNITSRKRKTPESEALDMFNAFKSELLQTIKDWRQDMNNNFDQLNQNINSIRNDFDQHKIEIKKELQSLVTEQSKIASQCAVLSEEVTDLKNSKQFMEDQYNDLKNRVDYLFLQTNAQNEKTVLDLEAKIDLLEQQARQCNVEISNIPERRNENLVDLLECLGKLIGYSIRKEDVVSIHRVPHAAQNNKPKNIVAKFTTRILRDNIISAYRLKKGLSSEQLGISGTSQKVFVNEHLTLRNKQLFRRAREAASSEGYKFVWTKHSTILVRETENSAVLAIRTLKDIEKIKGNTKSTKTNSST